MHFPARRALICGISIILFGTFLADAARAQARYEPGHVITSEGQRLEGEILNRDWIISPAEIQFRMSAEVSPRTLHATQIREFAVGDHLFRRYAVDVEVGGATSESALRPRRRLDGLFRVLSDGPLTILEYRDGGSFFFVEDEGSLVQLRREWMTSHRHGRNVTQIVDAFKDELAGRVVDCPDALQHVGGLALDAIRLSHFGQYYNACMAGTERPVLPGQVGRLRIGGAVAGVSRWSNHNVSVRHEPTNSRHSSAVPQTNQWRAGVVGLYEFGGLFNRHAIEVRAHLTTATYTLPVNRSLAWCRTDGPTALQCGPDFEEGVYSLFLYDSRVTEYDLDLTSHARLSFASGRVRPFAGIGARGTIPVATSTNGDVTLIHRSVDQELLSERPQDETIVVSRLPSFGPSVVFGLTTPSFQVDVTGSVQAYAMDHAARVLSLQAGVVYFLRR